MVAIYDITELSKWGGGGGGGGDSSPPTPLLSQFSCQGVHDIGVGTGGGGGGGGVSLIPRLLRGRSRWPGTHCLCMLRYPRISEFRNTTP